jgi:hypothetical protein
MLARVDIGTVDATKISDASTFLANFRPQCDKLFFRILLMYESKRFY